MPERFVCEACRAEGRRTEVDERDCRVQHVNGEVFFRLSPSCQRHPEAEMRRVDDA